MIVKDPTMPDFLSRRYKFHYITALNLLAGMGIPLHNISIKAVGIYENYMGEIRAQDPKPGTEITSETRISLEVGCSSPVDYMPYQFFYGLGGLRDTDNTWEENARSLMAPFDASLIRHDAEMHFHALKYEFGIIDNEHLTRFMNLFEREPEAGSSSVSDMMVWASILPSMYRWGGNASSVASVLERIFGYEFRIIENVRSSTDIPESIRYSLGSKTGRLGTETVIGRSFSECDSTYEVVISGVPAEQVSPFLPGGETRKKVEEVLDFFMPGDLDRRIRIKVGRETVKGRTERYLGYSSYT